MFLSRELRKLKTYFPAVHSQGIDYKGTQGKDEEYKVERESRKRSPMPMYLLDFINRGARSAVCRTNFSYCLIGSLRHK